MQPMMSMNVAVTLSLLMQVQSFSIRNPTVKKTQSLAIQNTEVWKGSTDAQDQRSYNELRNEVTRLWRINTILGAPGDPTCANGVANMEMTMCCKKSCGTCEDVDLCADAAAFRKATGKNADDCCPRRIEDKYVAPRYESCKGKTAPCVLPKGLKEKMANFKFPKKGRHAMDDCNEAVPRLIKLFKEAMAKGNTRGELYNEVESQCKSAVKVSNKIEFECAQKQKRAKGKKKVAKKKIKGAEEPDEIKHPLTGDSRLGGWEEDKEVSEEQMRFFGQLEENAQKIASEAEEILEESVGLKEDVTAAEKVSDHKEDVEAIINKADEICAKRADKLAQQFADASGDFDCGMPPAVEHTAEQCEDGNTKFKPKCAIKCAEGYDGKGTKNKLRCVRQGKFGETLYGEWFGMATCAAKNCGKPPVIDNAKQAKQEIVYPNEALYHCNEGFSVDADAKGNKTFIMPCQSSGTFYKDPSTQKCQPVNCGKPKVVENGKHEDREYVYTELATYTCDKGHTIDATAAGASAFIVSCQATGEFTERMKCRPVLCGPALAPPFTKFSTEYDQVVYSQSVDYTCEEGYSLNGLPDGETKYTLFCGAEGDFETQPSQPSLPQCKPVSCGEVPAVENGAVSQVPLVYKENVLAISDNGYSKTAIPNKGILMNIKCQADGSFKGIKTFEAVKCGPPPPVEHAVPESEAELVFEDQIVYACEQGYSTDMTDNQHAKSFVLSCEADGDFSAVPGQGLCANIDDCASHTCGPFGECVDKLMDYECKCNQGYEEVVEEGTGEKICGNIDDCGPSQCGVGECEDLVDDYNCICPEGYFEEEGPEEKICSPKVCGLPPVKNDAMTVPENIAGVKIDFTSDPVTYACLTGYTTTGKAGGSNHFTTTCQADGTFSEIPEQCKPVECPDAPEVDKGTPSATKSVFGETITYDCAEGHTIDGTALGDASFTISCLDNGELSLALECLPIICGEPDEAQNAFRPAGSLHFQQKVKYECFKGFTLDGDVAGEKEQELECQADGTFPSVENCNPIKCGDPPDHVNVKHSTVPMGDIHFPQNVEITCDDGYTVNGSPGGDRSFLIKCQDDGKFEKHSEGECEPVKCGALPAMANAALTGDLKELVFDVQAKYECLEGFTAGGEWDSPKSYHVDCLPTGEFSVPTPELQCRNVNDCERHTCGPHGRCVDKIADYDCDCESGFEVTEVDGEKVCGNKDDCGAHGCGPGVCVDLVNDYTCSCPSGHFQDAKPDGEKTCFPVQCALEVPNLEHGTAKRSEGKSGAVAFPETLKFECEEGYSTDATPTEARRSFQIACLATGELTEMFQCRAVSCGAPSILPFTKGPADMLKSIDYGETANYKCLEGYTLDGTAGGETTFDTKCNPNGKLDDPKTCLPVSCGRAPRSPKARAGIAGRVFFPMQIMYTCDVGYTLDGSATGARTFTLVCGGDGNFASTGPMKGCQAVKALGGAPKVLGATLVEAGGAHVGGYFASDVEGWVANKMSYTSVNSGKKKHNKLAQFLKGRPSAVKQAGGYCMVTAGSFPSAANKDICMSQWPEGGASKQIGQIVQVYFFSGVKGTWKFKSGQTYNWGWKAVVDGKKVGGGTGIAEFEAKVKRGAHLLELYGASDGDEVASGPLLSLSHPDSEEFVAATAETLSFSGIDGDAGKCVCKAPSSTPKISQSFLQQEEPIETRFPQFEISNFGSYCGVWGKTSKDAAMNPSKSWCYVGADCPDAKDDEGNKWAYCRKKGPAFTKAISSGFPLSYGQSIEYKCWPGYTLDGTASGKTKLTSFVTSSGQLVPPPPEKCHRITYTICGVIRDARNARTINGIRVEAGGKSAETRGGVYRIYGVPEGPVSLKIDAGAKGYINVNKQFTLRGNTACEGVGAEKLSPKMNPDQWRAVLSWGRRPSDLDSHTNWGSQRTLWYRRGMNYAYGIGVALEKDDVSSFGPETTYFTGVGSCRLSSIYCDITFKVYDYGRRGIIKSGSEGVVTLYHGDGIAGVFKVKDAEAGAISGDKNWWHVFTIDGATNKLKYSSSPASGSFLQRPPKVVPMNGTGYDGLGPFPRRKWKRRSQRDPELAKQRHLYLQNHRQTRQMQSNKGKHTKPAEHGYETAE
eukprot:gnl/MRDRNA2_/MRDRNA2_72053_c0_seq1.p1 gnl/MRDRNA2_/MRDRNA2_72053_c0~~gnl/MRDRNA2_/MRDRNA2_72053_c0_seq1.p1  ORF type:complete len:2101 (+),score=429.94 gnl/MRDRNA2_/MRDRNA2_72053_c0_seq1:113-6415(+)